MPNLKCTGSHKNSFFFSSELDVVDCVALWTNSTSTIWYFQGQVLKSVLKCWWLSNQISSGEAVALFHSRSYRLSAVRHSVGNADQQTITSFPESSGSASVCPLPQNEFSLLDQLNWNHDDTKAWSQSGTWARRFFHHHGRDAALPPFPTSVLLSQYCKYCTLLLHVIIL